MTCIRCHHPKPTGDGCAVCDPETLGTRLKAALARAEKAEAELAQMQRDHNPATCASAAEWNAEVGRREKAEASISALADAGAKGLAALQEENARLKSELREADESRDETERVKRLRAEAERDEAKAALDKAKEHAVLLWREQLDALTTEHEAALATARAAGVKEAAQEAEAKQRFWWLREDR